MLDNPLCAGELSEVAALLEVFISLSSQRGAEHADSEALRVSDCIVCLLRLTHHMPDLLPTDLPDL